MSFDIRRAVVSSIVPMLVAIAQPTVGHAFTLPPFTPDISTAGLSVAVSSTQVTPKVGPTSTNASFTLNTPFSSMDFPDAICSPPATSFILGLAPSRNCKTGEATITPISIPLPVSNTDCESFSFTSPSLTATWTVSTFTPPSPGGNQTVTCINGVCTITGGGTSVINTTSGTGNQIIITQTNTGSSGGSANQQFAFKATSTTPGVIVVPSSKVDAFILYNSEDMGSGYAGTCVTLNSTSISTQSRSINGTKTVTSSFAAH